MTRRLRGAALRRVRKARERAQKKEAGAVMQGWPFDKIIIYARNVIIRTHGDNFSQTKATSGLKGSIGWAEILYGL